MEVAERPVLAFPSAAAQEISFNEEELTIRQRKLEEAKKQITAIDKKIHEQQVMLRRLSSKPKFHKLQYVLKHRVAVYSGLRSVYMKYCCNVQEEIGQLQNY